MSEVDLSIIIPSRNERFLNETILDIIEKAQTNFEILVILEGYWPDEIIDSPRVHYIHFPVPRGMRGAINAGVAAARGKHILKCDAHCMFAPGFDKVLIDTTCSFYYEFPTCRYHYYTQFLLNCK